MAAADFPWPAWAGNGMGNRRARLFVYAFVSACSLLAIYIFISWETLPTLEQLKDQYGGHSAPSDEVPPPPSPPPPPPLAESQGESAPELVPALPATVTVTAPAVTVTVNSVVTEQAQTPQQRPECVDPYRRPGFLHIDNSTGDYNTTRWIPYTTAFLDAEDPKSAAYPYNATEGGEIWFNWESKPETKYFDDPLTPTDWMNRALKESQRRKHGQPKDETLSWLYGRVVLLVSDSVDRFNMQWFCGEFRDRSHDEGASFREGGKPHSTATCTIPTLNLTIVHWHLAGMTTYMPSWWWDAINIGNVPFELRYDKVWSATFKQIAGINGHGPDLIIWQSTVWDRKNWFGVAKEHYGEGHPMAAYTRPLVWEEIRFYAARVKTLLQFLQDKLGKDVPMMLRTMTLDQHSMAKDVQPYEMDRINRVLGERFGVEPFEWGRLIAGHDKLYRDGLHPGKGPSSWLWGTMVLEYLARAVGAGTAGGARQERAPYFDSWSECHESLTTIGSNAYH